MLIETSRRDTALPALARATLLLTLLQKMRSAGGPRSPEFLSTHPDPADRERELLRTAGLVVPLYQRAAAGR